MVSKPRTIYKGTNHPYRTSKKRSKARGVASAPPLRYVIVVFTFNYANYLVLEPNWPLRPVGYLLPPLNGRVWQQPPFRPPLKASAATGPGSDSPPATVRTAIQKTRTGTPLTTRCPPPTAIHTATATPATPTPTPTSTLATTTMPATPTPAPGAPT